MSSIPAYSRNTLGGHELPPPMVGRGGSLCHHGEIIQGVYETQPGRLQRILLSLPCDLYHSNAIFVPNDSGTIISPAPWRFKSLRAAKLMLEFLRQSHIGGELCIESNISPCLGLGSSTADVTATIRAVSNAFQISLPPAMVAELAVRAEFASDSIMFENTIGLFAHRDGCVVEDLGTRLPSMSVLGFNAGSNGDGIDTLALQRARYEWWEIEMFRPLVGQLRHAVETEDARALGRVATASAHINQRFLSLPQFDAITELAQEVGAIGVQVAHSGTVAGLLFEPGQKSAIARAQDGLCTMGIRNPYIFDVGRWA
jgi:uncharacterized protein involved in propanediol utilization